MKMPIQIILLAAVVCTVVAAVWILHPVEEKQEDEEFYYTIKSVDTWALNENTGYWHKADKIVITLDHPSDSSALLWVWETGHSSGWGVRLNEFTTTDTDVPTYTDTQYTSHYDEWTEGKVWEYGTLEASEDWIILKKV